MSSRARQVKYISIIIAISTIKIVAALRDMSGIVSGNIQPIHLTLTQRLEGRYSDPLDFTDK